MMNLLDPKVSRVPVKDNQENMQQLPTDDRKLHLDHNCDLGYDNEFVARVSVINKLLSVAGALPEGIRLSVKETYRPLSVQQRIYQCRAERLAQEPENRHLSTPAIMELTAQFIAPPSVAGHPTGGAVDVSLVNDSGCELDMGCGYDEDEKASNGRCFSFCDQLSAPVRSNRALLVAAMSAGGFINYPYEWWHWSYGDRYWAAVTGAPAALYGPVDRSGD